LKPDPQRAPQRRLRLVETIEADEDRAEHRQIGRDAGVVGAVLALVDPDRAPHRNFAFCECAFRVRQAGDVVQHLRGLGSVRAPGALTELARLAIARRGRFEVVLVSIEDSQRVKGCRAIAVGDR
jgi:hypothetical protein